jgi:dTDP-4-dehydrorhamnose reductase
VRILVTGAGGMLGRALTARLESEHEVHPLDQKRLDVTDPRAVAEEVERLRPELILHCAAWTDVDACQRDPARALRVNAWGARNVAGAAARVGARLVYFSTDYVFPGDRRRPYREYDPVGPVNVYGETKLFGEEATRDSGASFAIFRTSGLFGPGGRCFPRAILEALRSGGPLRVVSDQVIAPTYVADLAEAVRCWLEQPVPGVFHVTSRGETDWFSYARRILDLVGRPEVALEPIPSSASGRAAPRPAYSVLDTSNFRETFGFEPGTWEEGLRRFLEEDLPR